MNVKSDLIFPNLLWDVKCNFDTSSVCSFCLFVCVCVCCVRLRREKHRERERERSHQNIKIIGVELLRLEDGYGQQPERLRALLVGLSGTQKSESGSATGVMYDYKSINILREA